MKTAEQDHPERPTSDARPASDGSHDRPRDIPDWLAAEILDALEEMLARPSPARSSPDAEVRTATRSGGGRS
jgi:hypothetical protein